MVIRRILLAALAAVVVCQAGASDVVLKYDEAGHLVAVSNPDDDPEACGVPPISCPDDPHGTPFCNGGGCDLQCIPGYASTGGRCADISSDPTACGPDLVACQAPEHGHANCVQGVCGATCDTGYTAKGQTCVSLSTDPSNCGTLSRVCGSVPGYVACCSGGSCGASSGSGCVNIASDTSNCGWIGHVCGPAGSKPAACSSGRCATAAGTPRVDKVNGAVPTAQVFRSPFWSGLTLVGANLDMVTWVELEDWGSDTVDGTVGGVRSVPTSRRVTLPSGSGGPTIHFQQTATTLTINATSLEFQDAFDPRFETRHWFKVRVHYTASGSDRSILPNVAVSLTDLVPQGLPPPTITGIAAYYTWTDTTYDPATGLLAVVGDPTLLPVKPTSVLSPAWQREFPVLRVAPEGIYLPRGLSPGAVAAPGATGRDALVVFAYDPVSARPLNLQQAGLIIRGTDLWEDGPLLLSDAAGGTLPGNLYPGLFGGDRIVVPATSDIDVRMAYVAFGSTRGAARTPWPVALADVPQIERVDWTGGSQACGGAWCPKGIPSVVMTFTGKWLGGVDRLYLVGPSSLVELGVAEPLTQVVYTPVVNEFRVIDDHHIQLRIAGAEPSVDRVARGEIYYRDCSGTIYWQEGNTTAYRWFVAQDSSSTLQGEIWMLANSVAFGHSVLTVPRPGFGEYAPDGTYVCSANPPEPPPEENSPVIIIDGTEPPSTDCTNGMCIPAQIP
jgi:hypothetical protein